jgi:hypothetical protein
MKNQKRLIATVRQYSEAIGFAPDESDYLYESAIECGVGRLGRRWPGPRPRRVVYPLDPEARKIFAFTTEERRSAMTPPILSRRWGIGLEAAKRTLRATTQAGVRNVLAPTERKLRQRTLRGRTYTDTMFSKLPSIRGYKAAQVFTNSSGFDHFYLIESKGDANDGLLDYVKEVAIRRSWCRMDPKNKRRQSSQRLAKRTMCEDNSLCHTAHGRIWQRHLSAS